MTNSVSIPSLFFAVSAYGCAFPNIVIKMMDIRQKIRIYTTRFLSRRIMTMTMMNMRAAIKIGKVRANLAFSGFL